MLSTSALQAVGSAGGLYCSVWAGEAGGEQRGSVSLSLSDPPIPLSETDSESKAIPEPGVGPSPILEWREGAGEAVVGREDWLADRLAGLACPASCHTMI